MKKLFGLWFSNEEYGKLKEKYNKMVKIIRKMIKDNDSIHAYHSELKEIMAVFINHSNDISELKKIIEEED